MENIVTAGSSRKQKHMDNTRKLMELRGHENSFNKLINSSVFQNDDLIYRIPCSQRDFDRRVSNTKPLSKNREGYKQLTLKHRLQRKLLEKQMGNNTEEVGDS
jgi:hypothetical protein